MKEIRRVYKAQKKQNFRQHIAMVGVASALLGALFTALDQLRRVEKG